MKSLAEEKTKKVSSGRKDREPARAAKKKIVIDFPQELFMKTERTASELDMNRSNLIRVAVEQFIKELHRKRIEQQLIDGYTAGAALSRWASSLRLI